MNIQGWFPLGLTKFIESQLQVNWNPYFYPAIFLKPLTYDFQVKLLGHKMRQISQQILLGKDRQPTGTWKQIHRSQFKDLILTCVFLSANLKRNDNMKFYLLSSPGMTDRDLG